MDASKHGFTLILWICTDCGEADSSTTTPINPDNHNLVIKTSTATCTEGGDVTWECDREGCEHEKEEKDRPELGHLGLTAPFEATCTEDGNSEYSGTCTRNGCAQPEITGTVISALGHDFTDGICTRTDCFMIEMVNILGGTFTMGPDIDNNYAEVEVTLSSFRMSRFLVTQELFEAVMGTNPSWFNGENSREPAGGEIQGRRPVEMVNWYHAISFCNKLSIREGLEPVYSVAGIDDWEALEFTAIPTVSDNDWDNATPSWSATGFRLPTNAQWEYACRAGAATDWHFGDNEADLNDYGWHRGNSDNRTRQVGLKQPNAFGLYDMHGNVLEWRWDWWGDYPTEPQTDPTGTETCRIKWALTERPRHRVGLRSKRAMAMFSGEALKPE